MTAKSSAFPRFVLTPKALALGLLVFCGAATGWAQTSWSILNETGTSSFKNGVSTGNTVTVVVPSNAAVTIYTTDFSAINLGSGENYTLTFNFSSTAGFTGVSTGNRILGMGLFDSNSTATFADDAGLMAWLRSDTSFELREKPGVESVESLLKFGAYPFNNLGTAAGGTVGTLADNTVYTVNTFRIDFTGSGYRFGLDGSTAQGFNVADGSTFERTGYTNPGSITGGLALDLFAVHFFNTGASVAEFTISNVSLATAGSPVPEPGSFALFLGLAALAGSLGRRCHRVAV